MKRTLWIVEHTHTSEVRIFANKDKAWEHHNDYAPLVLTPAEIEVVEVTE